MSDRTNRRLPRGPLLGAAALALTLSGFLALGVFAPSPAFAQAGKSADEGFGPPAPPKIAGPKIEIVDPVFDWGEVLHGETIEHVYRVRNVGSETLRITNVKPG